MSTILAQLSDALAGVSTAAARSLVQVRRGAHGGGAGIIWDSSGLILTNAHVVSEQGGRQNLHRASRSSDVTVVLPAGEEVAAAVLAEDRGDDLAVLRVDARDLPPVLLGDARRLQAGDVVMALGFPWGVAGGATTGVVIGVGALPEMRDDGREWLAASLHLRPGHSGGPMVDAAGRLVGINTMMNGPDVGVAVPVHVVAAFLSRATNQFSAL
jgi:serine protease Do